jgi:tetratricopeptide (TPR) repeat protein
VFLDETPSTPSVPEESGPRRIEVRAPSSEEIAIALELPASVEALVPGKTEDSPTSDPFPSRQDTWPSEQMQVFSLESSDNSIPPVTHEEEELEDEPFFARADEHVARQGQAEQDLDSWAQEKVKQKSRPEVIERRARFARYVKWAVGGAAVLCLAAGIRTSMSLAHSADGASSVGRGAAVQAVAVQVQPSLPAEPAKPEVAEAPAPVAEAKPAETAAAPEATPPAAEEPAAPSERDPKAALEAKKESQRALERGKTDDAIEAGKRSVALDPEDGEAWLILGAAYQEKGQLHDAHAAYKSCLSEGKRGPKGECAAMLR